MPRKKRLVNLGGAHLEYELDLSRRSRRLGLLVYHDGRVAVRGPRFTPIWLIENFIRSQGSWINKKKESFRGRLSLAGRLDSPVAREFYKEKAQKLVSERVQYFNQIYGQEFGRVTIRDQKTRWGSCSGRRNLSFNYRLALLPPRLADYIIVHEICHLIEMNHSQNFWRQVARTVPDYKLIKKELKSYSLG